MCSSVSMKPLGGSGLTRKSGRVVNEEEILRRGFSH